MWSVLDLMGPILGHTPCLWHLTHHSSLILQVSEVAGSEIISTTRCNWGSPRESCAKKKNVSGWWWSTRKNPQGEFDKAVAVLPAGSTTINPHLWSDLPWGLPAAGPLPVLLWQWDKDFPAPKARQRMPGTCFSMEHTNNTCLFGGCVHASFGCWTKKTCSLDWGKQKPEPQLLYGLICFFFKLWHRFRDIGRCSPCPTANPAIFPMGWATRPGRLGRSISQQLNGFITWGWNQHISSLYLGFSRVLRGLLSGYLWCSLILHFLRDESDEPSINPSCSDVRQSTRVLTQTFGKSVKLRGKPSSISPI